MSVEYEIAVDILPSSIEAYLLEADFSATEILILKRLLKESALTLREIAMKTGKSTGVLDQAMKKLLHKEIVRREIINDSDKFIIGSLDAITTWVDEDMKCKRQLMVRRHQNFEMFIATLKRENERPEMEYFEGKDGMKCAYLKLLESGKELLHYDKVTTLAEEDPLRDFRVQYFRERHRRGIFTRVIAHNTPLGRRFLSRDAFEFRKTILVSPDECPILFERIIVGGVVACFDHDAKKACFIYYPEFAESEAMTFNYIWKQKIESSSQPATYAYAPDQSIAQPVILMRTRIFSRLREFFLSRKSIVSFAVFAAIAGGITFGMYRYTESLSFERMRDRVMSIASTAALQIDPKDLEALQAVEDWRKPEWQKVTNQLIQVRQHNDDIMYVYIFRHEKDNPNGLEIVADADSLNPYANVDDDPTNDVDMNRDGKIDGSSTGGDYLAWPGQHYPSPPKEAFDGLDKVTANENFYEDQYGKVISGYAPIRNSAGVPIAALVVDLHVSKLAELTSRVFSPFIAVGFFLLIFILFVFVRLAAFNRSLFDEVCQVFHLKSVLITITVAGILAIGITYGIYSYTAGLTLDRMRDRVMSIAATAATQIDPKDLEVLQIEADWQRPEWAKVVRQLEDVRLNNEDILFMYLFRRAKDNHERIDFVADSHSINPYANVDDDPSNNVDADRNGILNATDVLQWPGQQYPEPPSEALMAFESGKPIANEDFYTDSWGTMISGYAPIRDSEGNTIAVLAADMHVSILRDLTQQKFSPAIAFGVFVLLFIIFIFVRLAMFNRSLFDELCKVFHLKTIIGTLLLASILAMLVTYGLYRYTGYMNVQRIRERALSIAATGAIQFDPAALDQLRTREDVVKPQYKNVIDKLNDIRNQNPIVKYIYIMRPTSDSYIHEFVADADSIDPSAKKDLNFDGVVDEQDRLSPPGELYYGPKTSDRVEAVFTGFPSVESKPYTDQWGTFITGYGPIKDIDGDVIAFLGVDIYADKVHELTSASFSPLYYFLGFLLFFVALRLMIFNRPLFRNAWKMTQTRRVLVSFAFCAMIAYWVTFFMYLHTLEIMKQEIGKRLMSIAATAAAQIDAKDLEPLRFARDMRREEYQRVFTKLNEIRDMNPDIIWAFILRPTEQSDVWEFVVDADSNYNIPFYIDHNNDGVLDEKEENLAPGVRYSASEQATMKEGLYRPAAEKNFFVDQWGFTLSGYAPIRDTNNESVATVGFSIDISEVLTGVKQKFFYPLWFIILLIVLLFFRAIFI